MTDEKAKEILAEGNEYLKETKLLINDLKFRLSTAPESKKELLKQWVNTLENVYNYTLIQEIRVEDKDSALARRAIKIYEQKLKINELQWELQKAEKIEQF